ncbi:hypothetical protein RQP46_010292 [Phenoliferia psychrophenolica]
MNRNMGIEAGRGYTAGLVKPASAASEQRGQEFKAKAQHEGAVKAFLKALDQDPANCDAAITCIPYILGSHEDPLPLLTSTLTAAKARLEQLHGPNFFKSEEEGGCAGRFWGILDTRPYMRLQSSVAEMARVGGDAALACAANLECLRLCPGDNMGQRAKTVPLLLAAGRATDALQFCLNWLLDSDNDYCHPPLGGGDFSPRPNPVDPTLSAPHAAPLLAAIHKEHSAEPLYDLALSAFTCHGNCELARLSLSRASSLNPIVLRKILLQKAPPKDYNRLPYSLNGRETAQDYLVLSQTLWSAPAALAFASADPEARAGTLKECSACGVKEGEFGGHKRQLTRIIAQAAYCTVECQTSDWPNHKPTCKKEKDFIKMVQSITWA